MRRGPNLRKMLGIAFASADGARGRPMHMSKFSAALSCRFDIVAPRPVPVDSRCGVCLLGGELEVGGHGLACSDRDRH
jgi:hypothetical protein